MSKTIKYTFLGIFAFVLMHILVLLNGISFNSIVPYIIFILIIDLGDTVISARWQGNLNRVNFNKSMLCTLIGMILITVTLLRENFILFSGAKSSLSSVFVLGILCVAVYKMFSEFQTQKTNVYVLVVALLLALFSVFGHIVAFEGDYPRSVQVIWMMCALVGWLLMYYIVVSSVHRLVFQKNFYGAERTFRGAVAVGGVTFLISMISFTPFFLTFYPGVMEFDSWQQMRQVLGDSYSNHHPWLHTMIIKGLYQLGLTVFQSENKAMAVYTVFVMVLMSTVFALGISWLYRKGLKIWLLIMVGLIYIFCPINQMYSINMWKDVPFAAVVLLFLLQLCRMCDKKEIGKIPVKEWILFVILGFMVSFLRSNGLYVILGMIPFLLWNFWKCKKEALLSIIALLILIAFYKGPILEYFQVEEPDFIESLSIPAQQIGRVAAEQGKITDQQKELLEKVVNFEDLGMAYASSPHCSDAVKELVRKAGKQQYLVEHKSDYAKLYFQLGLQNPYIYLKAFIDETEGYWYHKITYNFIWSTYIFENGAGIERDSKVSDEVKNVITSFLEKYENHFWKYYGNGIFIYVFWIIALEALRKKSRYLIAYLPILGIWFTLLIATPVYADFRYAYAIFLSMPFLVVLSGKADVKEMNCPKSRSGKERQQIY